MLGDTSRCTLGESGGGISSWQPNSKRLRTNVSACANESETLGQLPCPESPRKLLPARDRKYTSYTPPEKDREVVLWRSASSLIVPSSWPRLLVDLPKVLVTCLSSFFLILDYSSQPFFLVSS